MTYIVCNEGRKSWGDIITRTFESREEAIEEAKKLWKDLSDSEKSNRHVYVLESADPDPDSTDHLDGNYVWKCDSK